MVRTGIVASWIVLLFCTAAAAGEGAPGAREDSTPREALDANIAAFARGLIQALERMDRRVAGLERNVERLSNANEALRKELAELRALVGREPPRAPEKPQKPDAPEPESEARLAKLGVLVEEAQGSDGVELVVREVEAGFAAAAAGVRAGDVILALNGARVRTLGDLGAAVKALRSGERLTLSFRTADGAAREAAVIGSHRRGEARAAAMQDAAKPLPAKPEEAPREKEAPVREPPAAGRAALGVVCEEGAEGAVVVVAVLKGSVAEKAGIQPGDRILEVGGAAVDSLAALRDAVSKAQGADPVTIVLGREEGARVTVTVALSGEAPKAEKPAAEKPAAEKPEVREPRQKKSEPAAKPHIGIDVEETQGIVRILSVQAGGPADGALQAGDVIVVFAGTTIRRMEDLGAAVGSLSPGKSFTVKVLRDGKELEARLTAGGP